MDVQLPAQPVDQSGFSQQRPLETQDGRSSGQGEEGVSSRVYASMCVFTPLLMPLT